ncbi:MAG TPA: type VI secretion system membrane subunit TssM, partial [Pyrinomonadaceae bacterium]
MSSTGTQVKTALLIAGKIFLVGLLVLLVLFLVPASTPVKILLVALVLLAWPAWVLLKHFRRSRAADGGGSDAAQNGGKGAKSLPPPTGTYEELTRGTEEVVQWLRGSKLAGGASADAAYALPWYVVAGPRGSGKTSLLLSSGLDFHVLPSQRASEQRVVRPTEHCDWKVTDSAVWLDTTGRYQTEGPERDEWAALIETVKRHRRTRPVDGFVLAANAADLLRMNEAQIEQQAKVLRARLDEAMARAGARFPVYLVFTHMDAVEGFGEFFDSFAPPERAQVWGSTFPLAQGDGAQAQFDAEFEYLYGRLLRRRMVQLGVSAKPEPQLRVFKFPGRFRRTRARLGAFATALFRPNPFSESPLLRGVYFTSSAGAGPTGAKQLQGGEYFTQSLFRDVLLPDRNVVAAAQAARRSPHLRRNIMFGALAALLLFLVGGMVVSFFANKRLIADADARGRRLTDIRKATSRGRATEAQVADELRAVEDVREVLAELDEHERNSPPVLMRFGLYAGSKLNSSDPASPSILRHIYFEAIEDRFLKPAVAKMEEDLREFGRSGPTGGPATTATTRPTPSPAATPGSSSQAALASATSASTEEDYLGRHYDLLKAYLMLSKPDKVEPTFLAQVLREYWEEVAPAGTAEVSIRQLEYFSTQAGREDAPHPEIDNSLIDGAQNKLVAYPVVNRVYKRITSEINGAVKFPVKLASIPNAREGGVINNTYSVPGAFTRDGHTELTERLKSSVADEFRKDDWVMRTSLAAGENIDAKKDELANMYYRDYVAHWQRFLQETKIRDFQSKEDAVRSLRLLSGSTSPLESLLQEVSRQTNLSGADGDGVMAWLKGLFTSKTGIGVTPVDKEFRPLVQFVSGKADASPMAEHRAQLKKVADALNANNKPLSELSKAMQAGDDTIGLRPARQAVADSLEAKGFSSSPASGDAARVLRLPL